MNILVTCPCVTTNPDTALSGSRGWNFTMALRGRAGYSQQLISLHSAQTVPLLFISHLSPHSGSCCQVATRLAGLWTSSPLMPSGMAASRPLHLGGLLDVFLLQCFVTWWQAGLCMSTTCLCCAEARQVSGLAPPPVLPHHMAWWW